jgi:hypothetical protein
MKIVGIASVLGCLVACGSSDPAGDIVGAPEVTDNVAPRALSMDTATGIKNDKGIELDDQPGKQMTTTELYYCCVTKSGCKVNLFGSLAGECMCPTQSAADTAGACMAAAKLD